MNREEQINKEAYRQSQVITDVAENGSLYETRLTEFEQGFKAGAKWADAHPFPSWIDCNSELPGLKVVPVGLHNPLRNTSRWVMIADKSGVIDIARYEVVPVGLPRWISKSEKYYPTSCVTHWRELPERPIE